MKRVNIVIPAIPTKASVKREMDKSFKILELLRLYGHEKWLQNCFELKAEEVSQYTEDVRLLSKQLVVLFKGLVK